MVKVSDCSCCECDDKAKKQQIEERALSSVNKIYTFDARTYWPDGTGMVTIPLPTQDQLNKIEEVGTLAETVAADTARIDVTEADIAAIKTGYQKLAEKGSANGYAGLDNNGRVALANLYTGTSANQVPIIGKQLLANEMLVVDADGHTIRSKPVTQTLSFRGIYATKSALPSEGNVSGDYAVVSDGTAQADTGYYVWGYNTATTEYEWVWTILFDANNYQLISNLQTAIGSDADDSHYPSSKAAKNYVDAVAGTLQQDVDTLETDMASVQTTIGEHTTGIANAITQAQAGYQSASVDGSNLVLTKGNGEADSVELPSGGGGGVSIFSGHGYNTPDNIYSFINNLNIGDVFYLNCICDSNVDATFGGSISGVLTNKLANNIIRINGSGNVYYSTSTGTYSGPYPLCNTYGNSYNITLTPTTLSLKILTKGASITSQTLTKWSNGTITLIKHN